MLPTEVKHMAVVDRRNETFARRGSALGTHCHQIKAAPHTWGRPRAAGAMPSGTPVKIRLVFGQTAAVPQLGSLTLRPTGLNTLAAAPVN